LGNDLLDYRINVLVKDACIIIDINKISEGEDLLIDTIVESRVNFLVGFRGNIELQLVGSKPSHPKKNIDEV